MTIALKQLLDGIEATHFNQRRKLRSEVRTFHLAIKPMINNDDIINDCRIAAVMEWITMAELNEHISDYTVGNDKPDSSHNSRKSPPENHPPTPQKAVHLDSSPMKQLTVQVDADAGGQGQCPSKASIILPSPAKVLQRSVPTPSPTRQL